MSTQIKTPEEIADAAIAVNYEDQAGLNQALAQGDVDADGINAMIAAAIEADRAQRNEPRTTVHDSRCTLNSYHEGECNVSAWKG